MGAVMDLRDLTDEELAEMHDRLRAELDRAREAFAETLREQERRVDERELVEDDRDYDERKAEGR